MHHYRRVEMMLVATARSSVHHTPYSVKSQTTRYRKALNMTDQPPPATPNVNVPPPPPQSGRSWIRWLLIGGGGCLMLVVLMLLGFAGCLAAFSGGVDEASDDSKSTPKAEIGEPLRVGDVTWVVEDAKMVTELTSSYEKPIQGNFVVVNFTFTNEGKEAATLDIASMALIDSEGRKSEADPEKFGYIPDDRNIFLENVNPGVTDEGQAIFTVAPDSTGFKLELGDADLAHGGGMGEEEKRWVSAATARARSLKRQLEQRVRLAGLYEDCGLIFASESGTPLNPENLVKRSFKPLLKRAGLPEIHFHNLRHTCATLLLGRGVHPKIVQELLGHATIAMTLDTYSHYLPSMGNQVAGAMVDALG